MIKNYPGEVWKTLTFDFEYTNSGTIEVSNFGRVKTNNKISKDKLMKGSMINGYNIIRLKFYSPRPEDKQQELDAGQLVVSAAGRELRELKLAKASAEEIAAKQAEVAELRKKLSKKFEEDLKKRTIHFHYLVHRMVADYFLKPPKEGQTIVAHKDFNKLNNKAHNLEWMTPEENYAHQANSPYVLQEKEARKTRRKELHPNTKLTTTKVMLLKKLLLAGKPTGKLAKQFKVTQTQIVRIQKGENWGDVEAAK